MQEWSPETVIRLGSTPHGGNRRFAATADQPQTTFHRQRSSMPHTNTRSRKPAVAAVVVLLLACLGLAACGGSSSTTSTSANVASTGTASGTSSTGSTSTTPGAPGSGRGAARFAAMRECLQKNGITLPKRSPGSRPGGGFVPGAGAGGGPQQLPSGVTRAQYEAALKKCGGGSGHFFRSGAARRINNPVFKTALTKYGDCLRQNGISLPPANTSGNGPIFDTKGINTASSQFKTASAKCRSVLLGAFRRPAVAPGASGASGATGAPAGGPPAGGASSAG